MTNKNLSQRAIIIGVVSILGLYVVIGPRRRPKLSDFTWSGIKQTLRDNIHLGLDLRGGSHLVMQVQTNEYLKKLANDNASAAENAAKEQNLPVKEAHADVTGGTYRVIVSANDTSKLDDISAAIKKKIDLNDWSLSTSGRTLTWTLGSAAQKNLSQQAVDQAMKIIESRINLVGVTEPTLQTHGAAGSNEILLQMPGIDDPERVKKILIGQSHLDLVHVVSAPNPSASQTYATEQEAVASLGGTVPANRRVLQYQERDEPTAASGTNTDKNAPPRWVVVEYPSIVDGSELRNANAVNGRSGSNDYQIAFSLKPSGAEKFGRWTGANINQYMAVVLDDKVKSIAFIKSQITDSGEISGRFTKESADDLALTLRSGALPAPLVYQEERTVGPSLGANSIKSGVTASVVGLVLVVTFMLIYYRGAGVNAVIALLLNMVLMLAFLIIFKATLTLPGIAGIILTIGMAVDSNVLIFERIREELRTGKTVWSSVDVGFARAFVTIIDTHVTTVVSSLFLFVFGTGPIRGFAVTLILGLLVNLFSAVYVSKTIFIWILSRKQHKAETISI